MRHTVHFLGDGAVGSDLGVGSGGDHRLLFRLALHIDGVGLYNELHLFVEHLITSPGVGEVCHLNQPHRVALLVFTHRDGGHLTDGVVNGDHHLLAERAAMLNRSAAGLRPCGRLATRSATACEQGNQHDKDNR